MARYEKCALLILVTAAASGCGTAYQPWAGENPARLRISQQGFFQTVPWLTPVDTEGRCKDRIRAEALYHESTMAPRPGLVAAGLEKEPGADPNRREQMTDPVDPKHKTTTELRLEPGRYGLQMSGKGGNYICSTAVDMMLDAGHQYWVNFRINGSQCATTFSRVEGSAAAQRWVPRRPTAFAAPPCRS